VQKSRAVLGFSTKYVRLSSRYFCLKHKQRDNAKAFKLFNVFVKEIIKFDELVFRLSGKEKMNPLQENKDMFESDAVPPPQQGLLTSRSLYLLTLEMN
jgi:hypothetical protein